MIALLYSLIGLGIVFALTLVGGVFVFFVKKQFSNRFSSIILALSSGVLAGAAIFCLYRDALLDSFTYFSTSIGVFIVTIISIIGVVFMLFFDKSVDKLGGKHFASLKKETSKILFAIILHNIPEGLSLGVVFGVLFTNPSPSAISGAMSLAAILAIHNFVQSITTSLSFVDLGMKKSTAFVFMGIAGLVELGFAVIGIVLSSNIEIIIPWLMALASGVMIYVAVVELFNDSLEKQQPKFSYIFFFVGTLVMLVLEILI